MKTARQQAGRKAEEEAAAHLALSGWRLLGRNVVVGRDEIDILAIDPGPPAELVFVEVRSATSNQFGTPEERVDRDKVAHLYRASRALTAATGLRRRVDLVVVDRRSGQSVVRHLRALEPA
ncbi:MAG: YraN family protein [Chloroflexota bacterium]|nr:YraN family protein [Chloroflexota bacterium]